MLLMAVFSLFWTAVSLRLAAAPFNLDQRGIALFALAAVGAVIVAPLAGRYADKGGTPRATSIAHITVIVGVALAAIGGGAWSGWEPVTMPKMSLLMLVAAALLLGAGVTCDQIVGRYAINMIRPEARGRTNGLYTGLFFVGGSSGAALSGAAWSHSGWTGVCGFGLAAAIATPVLRRLMER
jgi:MFS family permease